ncbi:ketoreductase [Microdochium trichocladiopsis]|uniref:Ketoreductase n=1 Tax=Microdochium trichocladiopsis TaxID=1682393 RepID=A0A9P8XUP0_9PEZI|nr:ketoreductase [Microdochium trichocladiopsis]KAH7014083.1 ketoreductase [Microdochium trichocladiopsis]
MAIPNIRLGSEAQVPVLAYGTGTTWIKQDGDSLDRKTIDGIKEAIELGYRHLDGAQYYGTEAELGQAIRESGVPRSDFFITTKAVSHVDVEGSLRESCRKLQTDHVDLYLIHEPFSATDEQDLQQTWADMEICLDKGLARHIGVSNFLPTHLDSLVKTARVKPAVNQIELHPYLQRQKVIQYCRENGIVLQGFAPLTPFKVRAGPVDEICSKLAERHGVSESSILLRWVVDQGIIVITTSGQKTRLQQYLRELPNFVLSQEEVQEIAAAGKAKSVRQFFADGFGPDNFD